MESEESDHFSDIYGSTTDLATPVISHFDRLSFKISQDYGGDLSNVDPSASAKDHSSQSTIDPPPHTPPVAQRRRSVSSSSSSSLGNNKVDPGTVLNMATREIIDSERKYIEDLQEVIVGYLADWKERACLKVDEIETLFGNIEQIYDCSRSLMDRLSLSKSDPLKIAACFIDFKDQFENVYSTYCTRYPEAIALLTRLLQSTHTNSLLTSTQKSLHHTLPLDSYLLKPVQRILKYHLLLENLGKHCTCSEVTVARDQMQQVAFDIDQLKKKLEQRSRVKQLSGILDGWMGPDLTVLGELRQEGSLVEDNKPRQVFLFDTMLIVTKPKEDKRLQFKLYIHRKDIMLIEHIPGQPTSFNVIPYSDPRNQVKFTARNRNVKRLWAHHIKSVMLEDLNVPNRAKDLVYKLGDEEDLTPTKKWGQTASSSSSTPEYLERRQRCRRSELRQQSLSRSKQSITTTVPNTIPGPLASHTSCPNCHCGAVKSEFRTRYCTNNNNCAANVKDDRKPDGDSDDTSSVKPQRIKSVKKEREKKLSTSTFYRTLSDDNDNEAEAVEIAVHEDTSQLPDETDKVCKSDSKDLMLMSSKQHVVVGSVDNIFADAQSMVSSSPTSSTSNGLTVSDSNINYITDMAAEKNSHRNRGNSTASNRGSKPTRIKKNSSHLYNSLRSLQRTSTTVAGSSGQPAHTQGSASLGARIANVDYADPQQLRFLFRQQQSLKDQRDSVLSVTTNSSNDSGSDERRQTAVVTAQAATSDSLIVSDSYYEQGIEDCLEDQQLFRDSAVYSDNDNERLRHQQPPHRPPPAVPPKSAVVMECQQRRLEELEIKRKQKRTQ